MAVITLSMLAPRAQHLRPRNVRGASARRLRPLSAAAEKPDPAPQVPEPAPKQAEADRGRAYYEGMLKTPLTDADAEKDMITPSLKLMGYSALALTGLFVGFMASNGLL